MVHFIIYLLMTYLSVYIDKISMHTLLFNELLSLFNSVRILVFQTHLACHHTGPPKLVVFLCVKSPKFIRGPTSLFNDGQVGLSWI